MPASSELKRSLHSSLKRSKLETPYDAGDCGYYVLCVGLLYLGMQAKYEPELAKIINSSSVLSSLLSNMPTVSRFFDMDNTQCINQILKELDSPRWDKISFKELLSEFSNGVRNLLATSEWGLDYFKSIIKEGSWVIDNQKWMNLASFKRLDIKILETMEMLSQDKLVSIEEAGELRFKATLSVFNNLPDKKLEEMAKEVIKTYYGPGSEKAWLDSEFLKHLSQELIPSSENLFFDCNGVEITSNGPSKIHWYIDVPENEITDSLLQSVNAGHSKDLKKIEVYNVRKKSTDMLSFLLLDQEELLQTQQKLIKNFEMLAFALQEHMHATHSKTSIFPKQLFDAAAKLADTPNQAAIDDALMPILALDEAYMVDYQKLSMIGKQLSDNNEKFKKNKQQIDSQKDQASVTALVSSGLSFNPTLEKPKEAATSSTPLAASESSLDRLSRPLLNPL